MASFQYLVHLPLILQFIFAPLSFSLFSTHGPERAITQLEGSHILLALDNMLSYDTRFNESKWYDSGIAFAKVVKINGKSIAIRYVRWTQFCTVGPWENAQAGMVLEDFRTTVPYLRPFLIQGFSWGAVSNGYAWVDYYMLNKDEIALELPSSIVTDLTNSYYDFDTMIAPTTKSTSDNDNYTELSCEMFIVSSFSPVEKTGFLHCPVSPLVLVNHNNGIWDVLKVGEHLTSANRRVQLTMQSDCNLVLNDIIHNSMLWSSKSAGHGNCCFLRLQSDGNLVIYKNIHDKPVWAINQGCGRLCVKFSSLVVQDDGNLVLHRSENGRLKRVWDTNTKVV